MAYRHAISYQFSALIWSAVLHSLVLLFAILGLPELWKEHRESLPVAMSVEVLSVSDVTNIKKQIEQQKDKTKKEQIAKAKKAVSASSSNQQQEEEKKKVIAPPDTKKPKPTKKVDKPKQKPKPKEQKEVKKKKTDLDSILKSVADAAKKEQGDEPQKANTDRKKARSDDYNPSLPMSMTEIDAIRSQFVQCWNIPAGARDAHELKVVLDIHLRQDGSVVSAELAKETGRYYRDGFFRAAVDSAIRAVYRCNPIRNLPPKKYETWKYIEMTFDPRDMLY